MSDGEQKSSWNYRLVRRQDGSFGVHEVHYADGVAIRMTMKPASLGPLESIAKLKGDLRLMSAALEKEVFVEPEEWK